MNEITFVIATAGYGGGPAEGVEPVIDGVSVVDLLARVDGEITYAGLVPRDPFLQRWRSLSAAAQDGRIQLLGLCLRGRPVQLGGSTDADRATHGRVVGVLGQQSRRQARPRAIRRTRAVRVRSCAIRRRARHTRASRGTDTAETRRRRAACRDPERSRRLAEGNDAPFGRDFHTPSQSDATKRVAAEGLRALSEAGHPVTDEIVREWARNRRYTEEGVERCVQRFREIGRLL